MAMGKNITWEKRLRGSKRRNITFPRNIYIKIKAVGKNIKWERGKGTEILGRKIKI